MVRTWEDLVARVRARDQALGAGGCCPALAGRPAQRHIEQDHRPDMESCEGVGTHKRSCPDLKHQPVVRMPSPDLNVARVPSQKIGRELGTHKKVVPGLEASTGG